MLHWQPILHGEDAASAEAIARDLVSELKLCPFSIHQGLKGDASLAFLFAQTDHTAARHRLEASLEIVATQLSTVSLFAGAAGVAWMLGEIGEGPEVASAIAHIDAALLRHLDSEWTGSNDLLLGLAGLGVYAVACSGRTLELAERVLSYFEATATFDAAGATWYTRSDLLIAERRVRYPDGVVDLGVAHGIPGIIGMLAQFVENGIERERSSRLLEAAISWLLESNPEAQPRFAADWPSDGSSSKRIGWCYGDAGVAGVLLRASRTINSASLQDEAIGLLHNMVRPLDERGVIDASFCHGAAGIAHIYNVAFQQTNDPVMRAEAERWLRRVIRLRVPGTGIAGYASYKINGVPRWESDPSLLSGACGIALVLLAAIADREPAWQRLFLL